MFRHALLLMLLGAAPLAAQAQWLDYKTPGIPRLKDGKPDLKAKTPRTATASRISPACGSPTCRRRTAAAPATASRKSAWPGEQMNMGRKLQGGLPYTEWSKEQMKIRRANGGREDPHTYCKPPNFPRAWTLPQYIKIVQTPKLMVVLHEFNAAYREIYMDGRPLPKDPNPTWNGYSIGHWEGDVLVIETNGIRDDMWLDIQGSPITEAAKVTERLKRPELRRHADRDHGG